MSACPEVYRYKMGSFLSKPTDMYAGILCGLWRSITTARKYDRILSLMFDDGILNRGRVETWYIINRAVRKHIPDNENDAGSVLHKMVHNITWELPVYEANYGGMSEKPSWYCAISCRGDATPVEPPSWYCAITCRSDAATVGPSWIGDIISGCHLGIVQSHGMVMLSLF